jgi:hypothetical protein
VKVAVKYLILVAGFMAAYRAVCSIPDSAGAGITAAGAFIAFALLEIQDLKIINSKPDDD